MNSELLNPRRTSDVKHKTKTSTFEKWRCLPSQVCSLFFSLGLITAFIINYCAPTLQVKTVRSKVWYWRNNSSILPYPLVILCHRLKHLSQHRQERNLHYSKWYRNTRHQQVTISHHQSTVLTCLMSNDHIYIYIQVQHSSKL